MNEDQNITTNPDSADCLDAVVAFRSFKNLMFWLALICLAALQAIFWANYLGYLDKTGCPCPEATPAAVEAVAPSSPAATPIVALAAQAAIAGALRKPHPPPYPRIPAADAASPALRRPASWAPDHGSTP